MTAVRDWTSVGPWPTEGKPCTHADRAGCKVPAVYGMPACPYHFPGGPLPVNAGQWFDLSPRDAARVAKVAARVRRNLYGDE